MHFTSRWTAAFAVAGFLLLTGCGGGGSSSSPTTPVTTPTLTIHYKRIAADYTGWGLHLWNDASGTAAIASSNVTTWASPRAFDSVSNGWDVVAIPLLTTNANVNFIIHKGDAKSPMKDLVVNPSTFGTSVWVVQDTTTLYASESAANAAVAKVGSQADDLDLTTVAAGTTSSALPANWNKRGQFMEIFVRSFKDSDGDGQGDIQGLISKLDYLQSLGITGIWLMPVYKNQDGDHGYSVTDYRSLDPSYGTLADFDTLIAEAHKRGIGIILDYVMNHSAALNPLFLDAVSSASNARRDWYLWNTSDPGWTGISGESWHISESGYYYGIFGDTMPDWNLTNASVVAYHMNTLRYWLNRGVDGFRFDAAEYLVENGASAWLDQPQNYALLLQAQNVINAYDNRYMVCEAPDNPSAYAATTACGHAFAFFHGADIIATAANGTLASGLVTYLSAADRSRLALFLSNHDSFAGARPYAQLSGHSGADYKIAAAIEILGSDTPFTLYGEEVGMSDNASGGDAGIRAPMSWTADTTTAGFTTGTPYRALSTNVASQNVALEDGVSGSLLEWYRALFAVRTAHPVLQSGTLTLLSAAGDSSLIFLRQEGSTTAVVLINLGQSAQTLSAATGLGGASFTPVFPASGTAVTADGSGKISLSVAAQSVVILTTP